jgi:hypothetical protein
MRCLDSSTHKSDPQIRVPKRQAPNGNLLVDGAGTANRRYAVAAASWGPVGGARAPGSGGHRRCLI